jgi:hypothetical protein
LKTSEFDQDAHFTNIFIASSQSRALYNLS